jgi:hypothetical protein
MADDLEVAGNVVELLADFFTGTPLRQEMTNVPMCLSLESGGAANEGEIPGVG